MAIKDNFVLWGNGCLRVCWNWGVNGWMSYLWTVLSSFLVHCWGVGPWKMIGLSIEHVFLLYGSVVFAVVRIEALLVINGWQLESWRSFFVRYRWTHWYIWRGCLKGWLVHRRVFSICPVAFFAFAVGWYWDVDDGIFCMVRSSKLAHCWGVGTPKKFRVVIIILRS